MTDFFAKYTEAVATTAGFFWMAFWAFALGYLVSSMVQVFVTQDRIKKYMGKAEGKSMALATFFGFISSSCSFAALATTKSLFKKGAGFVPSMAFLLASTNLVIELGIIISVFMAWQFVVGEYLGGLLLILCSWLLVKLTRPKKLIERARERLQDDENSEMAGKSWRDKITSWAGWKAVAKNYFMEWKMVWKDVAFGFTVAGIIAAFVPDSFYQSLFINSGQDSDLGFLSVLEHIVVGPVAAFFTFIGSMGNIPLAALLYGKGVSFAGVMAFIFSDLVVFPVLRINAKYYGWKMSLYILFLLFVSLIVTSLALHYGMDAAGLLPQSSGGGILEQEHFKINYTFFLNLGFLALNGFLAYLAFHKKVDEEISLHREMADKGKLENVLKYLAIASFVWLAVGGALQLTGAGS